VNYSNKKTLVWDKMELLNIVNDDQDTIQLYDIEGEINRIQKDRIKQKRKKKIKYSLLFIFLSTLCLISTSRIIFDYLNVESIIISSKILNNSIMTLDLLVLYTIFIFYYWKTTFFNRDNLDNKKQAILVSPALYIMTGSFLIMLILFSSKDFFEKISNYIYVIFIILMLLMVILYFIVQITLFPKDIIYIVLEFFLAIIIGFLIIICVAPEDYALVILGSAFKIPYIKTLLINLLVFLMPIQIISTIFLSKKFIENLRLKKQINKLKVNLTNLNNCASSILSNDNFDDFKILIKTIKDYIKMTKGDIYLEIDTIMSNCSKLLTYLIKKIENYNVKNLIDETLNLFILCSNLICKGRNYKDDNWYLNIIKIFEVFMKKVPISKDIKITYSKAIRNVIINQSYDKKSITTKNLIEKIRKLMDDNNDIEIQTEISKSIEAALVGSIYPNFEVNEIIFYFNMIKEKARKYAVQEEIQEIYINSISQILTFLKIFKNIQKNKIENIIKLLTNEINQVKIIGKNYYKNINIKTEIIRILYFKNIEYWNLFDCYMKVNTKDKLEEIFQIIAESNYILKEKNNYFIRDILTSLYNFIGRIYLYKQNWKTGRYYYYKACEVISDSDWKPDIEIKLNLLAIIFECNFLLELDPIKQMKLLNEISKIYRDIYNYYKPYLNMENIQNHFKGLTSLHKFYYLLLKLKDKMNKRILKKARRITLDIIRIEGIPYLTKYIKESLEGMDLALKASKGSKQYDKYIDLAVIKLNEAITNISSFDFFPTEIAISKSISDSLQSYVGDNLKLEAISRKISREGKGKKIIFIEIILALIVGLVGSLIWYFIII